MSSDNSVVFRPYGNHLRWSLYRAGITPLRGLYACYTGNLCTLVIYGNIVCTYTSYVGLRRKWPYVGEKVPYVRKKKLSPSVFPFCVVTSGFRVLFKNSQDIIHHMIQFSGYYSKYTRSVRFRIQRIIQNTTCSVWFSIQGIIQNTTCSVWFRIQGIIQNATCSVWFIIQGIIQKWPGYYSAYGSVIRVLFKLRPAASGSGFSVLFVNIQDIIQRLFHYSRYSKYDLQRLVKDSAYYSKYDLQRLVQYSGYYSKYDLQRLLKDSSYYSKYDLQRLVHYSGYYSKYDLQCLVHYSGYYSKYDLQRLVHYSVYY